MSTKSKNKTSYTYVIVSPTGDVIWNSADKTKIGAFTNALDNSVQSDNLDAIFWGFGIKGLGEHRRCSDMRTFQKRCERRGWLAVQAQMIVTEQAIENATWIRR